MKKNSFNHIIRTLITAIAVIALWRGLWGIMDLYLFPANLLLSYLCSVILGIAILYILKPKISDLI